MTDVQLYAALAAIIALGFISFFLGYDVAESRERKASKAVEKKLRDLENWAADNWPTEYHAHRLGHSIGYQQGILHAADYAEDDHEDPS